MKVVPSPFNKASADTVLRSSDGVEFRVRSAILIEVSPFFEDLFGLPQSGSESPSLSPITMAEDSRTLQILLQLCYPLVDRVPADLQLEEARAVLEAALKYDIDTAKELMRRALMKFANTQPLRVYAIACIHKLEPEARYAATQAVAQYVVFGHYVPELEETTAACYHRLVQFQTQPSDANFTFTSAIAGPHNLSDTNATGSELSDDGWKNASSPFDSPNADVIIVSQDQVRFRVHSLILKLASPTFSDMLDNPRPYPHHIFDRDAEAQGVAHYLVLPESSTVLQTILGSCYYLELKATTTDTYNVQLSAMDAAVKYSLQHTIRILKGILLNSVSSKPLQTFALASLYGWEVEAREAAVASLHLNVTDLYATYDPILENLSGGPYFWLLDYHRKCRLAAINVATHYETSLPDQTTRWLSRHCNHCSIASSSYSNSPSIVSARLKDYMTSARSILMNTPHAIRLSEGAAHSNFVDMLAVGCDYCNLNRARMGDGLISAFKKEVVKSISEVKFQLAP